MLKPFRTTADLGLQIRAIRIAAGLTQVDAAALCGVSGPFINNLERGKPTAQVGKVLDVCHGLGIQLVAELPHAIDDLSEVPARKPRRKSIP
jgi:HTH-type transcriptional regulator / antitoxin HipB